MPLAYICSLFKASDYLYTMLMNFVALWSKYAMAVKGVLHVGAHMCEELDTYRALGITDIVWVEANSAIAAQAQAKYPGATIVRETISDVDGKEVEFMITNNGQSSAILEFGTHSTEHPTVVEVSREIHHTKRLDTIYAELGWAADRFDFLNIDIQGAELLALRGMGDILANFKYLYLEVNEKHLYQDCALVGEIDQYLEQFGFRRAETQMTGHGWGDAFYVKL